MGVREEEQAAFLAAGGWAPREVVGEEDDRGRLGQIPAPWGKPETIKIVSA